MYLAECVCINAPSNFWGKKYKQIHTIQTNTCIIHTLILHKCIQKYIQNKSVTMCIYVYLCACICMYMPMCIYVYVLLCYYVYVLLCVCITMLLCVSMCMSLHVYACIVSVWLYFMHPKTWSDVHVVCACICMSDCHCSPVVICVQLGYIEHHVLQSEREGTICFEILFYFSKGDSRVVRGPNHGPRVDVVQGAAWAGLATPIAHAPFVARLLVAMHDSGNGAVIPCRNERQHADTDTIPTDTCTYMHIPTFHT